MRLTNKNLTKAPCKIDLNNAKKALTVLDNNNYYYSAQNLYKPYKGTLLSKEKIKELSKLKPHIVVKDTFFCWMLIMLAWTACVLWTNWWVVLLSIPVIGLSYHCLYIIGHDGYHRRLFKSKWLNDLFSDVFLRSPIGEVTHLNHKNHLMHHNMLGSEKDPEGCKYMTTFKETKSKFIKYFLGVGVFFHSRKTVLLDCHDYKQYENNFFLWLKSNYTVRDILILITWQALLLFGLSFAIGFWAYPVLWILPVYLFTYIGNNIRSFAEHSLLPGQEQRLTTFISNPIERLFISPMNMNFHTVHHLWTSIPYYNLEKVDKLIRNSNKAEGLEWRGSYISYLIKYFKILPVKN